MKTENSERGEPNLDVVVREGFLSTVYLCTSVCATCLCNRVNSERKNNQEQEDHPPRLR